MIFINNSPVAVRINLKGCYIDFHLESQRESNTLVNDKQEMEYMGLG